MKPLKYWTSDGFEISSFKYSLKERVNKSYTTSGNDNTNLCTYTYNELGFRGDSVKKEGFKVMSLGCSITEGVGVNDNETWPAQFCSHIENGVNLNFGTGGRSNDFICRCLMSYYDLIKPDLVLIMYTSPQRREIYTNEGGIEPYMPTNAWGHLKETEEGQIIQSSMDLLQNDNEDFVNWHKNHLLIKYFLETKKCNWLWNGWMGVNKEYSEFNRFDGGYGGRFIDLGVDGQHPGPKHNVKYLIELYNYIYKNFRNYLPDNIVIDRNLI
jgi:hypothetical protein